MSKSISAGFTGIGPAVPVKLPGIHPHPKLFVERIADYLEVLARGRDHFRWVAFTMILQAAIVTPLVCVVILSTGHWTPLWFAATASMYASFIPALAGLQVKWVRFVFLVNCIVSVLIVLTAVLHSIIV